MNFAIKILGLKQYEPYPIHKTRRKEISRPCYEQYKLFEIGSWLYKPVKTVMDLMDHFEGQNNLQVLDLGSGIGRNSIPIAQIIKIIMALLHVLILI